MSNVYYLVPPKYTLEKDLLEAGEGSSPVINFQVRSNPPLEDTTRHRLTKGGNPASKRFKVSQNAIMLNHLEMEDSGMYIISCENEDGETGREELEIKVLESKYIAT